MPCIPEETLNQIKNEVSLKTLVESRGITLTPHGKDWIGLCPFHDDHDPSLVITPDKNLWHCLGACREGGSVIDWVMKSEGVSFRHAVELLKTNNPSTLAAEPRSDRMHRRSRKLDSPLEIEAPDRDLLKQTVEYYHRSLKNCPDALEYLKKRGLVNPELINRFKLGFSDRTLGLRLPEKNRQAGHEVREKLQHLGILRETGHEHFRGSLIIPVLNQQGTITEIYGRKICNRLKKGTPLHLYLPGPHRGVWNIQALGAGEEIILCESLIDALTFWSHGFRNVTASYGVEGFTADHFAAFREHEIKRVIIAYDGDKAGNGAAQALALRLEPEGISSYRAIFPMGTDVNEYALSVKEPARKLKELLLKAEPMGRSKPRPLEYPALVGKNEMATAPDRPDARDCTRNHTPDHAGDHTRDEHPTTGKLPASMDIPVEVKQNEIHMTLGNRRYRFRGLGRNMSFDQMKVNILAATDDGFHVDNLDLYAARHRTVFIREAASEMGVDEEVVRKDLGKALLKLEELQEEQIKKATEPRKKVVTLTEEERAEALKFLKSPNLLKQILADFKDCGVIGEETNKLVGYLAAVSRKLDNPLAVIIQSSSAAGKTALMEAILAFVPEECKVKYSAVTGQSLFYMSEADLKHKCLAIVEEEGAERASYALKLLQSEGELTIASTGKDAATGRLTTHEYKVEGPVMILLTTTAIEIDEELLNRCIVLTVDENREQTRAIHEQQREKETLEGLLAQQDKSRILRIHRNAQRLLHPILVANPYARDLTFIDDRTRSRRDHMKYLTLIRSIALLHQYQRPVKTVNHQGRKVRYIEVTLEDIAVANRLAHEVLGRSIDELPPQTRRLLMLLDEMVTRACGELKMDRKDFRFTRRRIREKTGLSYEQVRVHLDRLVDYEYVLTHRGGRGQSFVYELIYDGKGRDGKPFLMNLLDTEKLKPSEELKVPEMAQMAAKYDAKFVG